MTRLNKFLIFTALLLSIGAFTLGVVNYTGKKNIYYVNNGKLYEGFSLKVEYENQIKTLRNQRKNSLDSIELTIRQLEAQNRSEEFKFAKEYYLDKIRKFEDEEESLLEEYNQQIWKRLNQYAIDFGRERNIDILFGASGDGNLLHASENFDLTDELLTYSNKRYAGK